VAESVIFRDTQARRAQEGELPLFDVNLQRDFQRTCLVMAVQVMVGNFLAAGGGALDLLRQPFIGRDGFG
jgi:hypothetical protein